MILDNLMVVAFKATIILIITLYNVQQGVSINPAMHGRQTSDLDLHHQEQVCAEPDDLQIRYEGYNTDDYVLVSMKKQITAVTEKQISDAYLPPRMDTCRLTRKERHSLDPRKRAICPVEWVYNTSMTRYPITIPYARCKCSYCRGIQSMAGGCEISWYNVVVLRSDGNCINGKRVYYPSNEPVPVGCFCSLRPHHGISRE